MGKESLLGLHDPRCESLLVLTDHQLVELRHTFCIGLHLHSGTRVQHRHAAVRMGLQGIDAETRQHLDVYEASGPRGLLPRLRAHFAPGIAHRQQTNVGEDHSIGRDDIVVFSRHLLHNVAKGVFEDLPNVGSYRRCTPLRNHDHGLALAVHVVSMHAMNWDYAHILRQPLLKSCNLGPFDIAEPQHAGADLSSRARLARDILNGSSIHGIDLDVSAPCHRNSIIQDDHVPAILEFCSKFLEPRRKVAAHYSVAGVAECPGKHGADVSEAHDPYGGFAVVRAKVPALRGGRSPLRRLESLRFPLRL
mmetsp:Transcript_22554/g.49878  ORF Transcript_22554/g.49878 Transcript_22554/m.49878 type:complete len:306 (+) Transcript_22554:657-1574(+)